MIVLLSPSKTMDFERSAPMDRARVRDPLFQNEALELVRELRQYNVEELANLMNMSRELARINKERFENFSQNPGADRVQPAIFAYQGSVYQEIEVESLHSDQLEFSQKHLRIISGLYGILRPMDGIQPYRLEMSTKLQIGEHKNLYQFWQNKLTRCIQEALEELQEDTVINLASKEYYQAIDFKALNARVVTPVFKNLKNNTYKVIGVLAKKARGKMTREIIRQKINKPDQLTGLSLGGYRYSAEYSKKNQLVFLKD